MTQKKVYDHDNEEYKESLNETTKTINGYDGIYSTKNGFYGFSYCKDKRYIMVVMNDESLLEKVVPK